MTNSPMDAYSKVSNTIGKNASRANRIQAGSDAILFFIEHSKAWGISNLTNIDVLISVLKRDTDKGSIITIQEQIAKMKGAGCVVTDSEWPILRSFHISVSLYESAESMLKENEDIQVWAFLQHLEGIAVWTGMEKLDPALKRTSPTYYGVLSMLYTRYLASLQESESSESK